MGFLLKMGLMYVDGTALNYKDQKVGTVTDTEKTFVGMGAYVLIWPVRCITTRIPVNLAPW